MGRLKVFFNKQKWKYGHTRARAQFSNCIKNIIKGQSITKIISNPQKRNQLRGCYKSLNKTKFNNTSLLVLHGPLTPYRFSPLKTDTQLLTGDISLKQHVPEISAHFKSSLSDVGLCLVPHHGSIRNWNKAILPYLSHDCRWVVSTGKSNRNQPSADILRDIKKHGHSYVISDDDFSININTSV